MAEINYTDEELIPLIRQGDESAFGLLYNRFAEELTGFAASRLSSLEEAKDVIHDLFVYIWKEKEEIFVRVSVRAFLFSAVKYRIIDHIRKNITREKYKEQLSRLDAFLPSAIEKLDVKDLQNKVDTAVSNLSPRVQQVFRMSRYENLSTKKIAQQLQISERTVKNQLTTALTYLREKLGSLAIFLVIL